MPHLAQRNLSPFFGLPTPRSAGAWPLPASAILSVIWLMADPPRNGRLYREVVQQPRPAPALARAVCAPASARDGGVVGRRPAVFRGERPEHATLRRDSPSTGDAH